MASEARIQTSLQVKKGTGQYQSQPTSFNADVVGPYNGPTPGAVTVGLGHTLIPLAQLTGMGGLCRLMNCGELSDTDFIVVGLYDGATGEFYPFLDLLPGESYVLRLSRYIDIDLVGVTGTGTGTGTKTLAAKAVGTPSVLLAEIFDP